MLNSFKNFRDEWKLRARMAMALRDKASTLLATIEELNHLVALQTVYW